MSRGPATVVAEPYPFTAEEASRIRGQLERLLASPQFRSSRRCHLLLQHITDRALAGETSQFKERTLGVAVFGREPDYDTNQDPIVRATAAEIRKKLAQYYQEQAHQGEVRITVQPGSYVPGFHFPEAVSAPVALSSARTATPSGLKPRSSKPRWWLAATLLIASMIATGFAYQKFHHPAQDLFWGRMLGSNGILFCVGQPPVFNIRSDEKQFNIWEKTIHSPEAWAASSETIAARDLVPMPDRYFAVGDAVALVHIASFFEHRKTPYFIRSSSLVSYEDLREHPAILIGAFDNDWTLRFGAPLRYSFMRSFDGKGGSTEWIRDRDHPNQIQWQLVNPWPDWNVSRDYAIVNRLLDPSTDRMMVTAAGITQYGTVAASEFLSNPDFFAQALPKLPSDWPKKNVQIVLQVPVVHGASGRPDIIAVHTW